MFSFLGFPTKTNVSHHSNLPTDDERRTTGEDCSEAPPMFPAQNSIQRATTSTSTATKHSPAGTNNHPILRIDSPEDDDEDDPQEDDDDHSDIHELDIDNLALPHSTLKKPVKPRKKVQLMPGFSQLDWAKLKSSGANLRGEDVTSIRRITRSELAEHRSKEDAWSSFNGKVYNITPYLNYHPGGVRELMRVAGKDGTELFMKTHAWISVDGMLDSCLVGFLVND
ncbi:hypothetical protein PTTG_01645 [Puccinia triticina 1-1 BBBD Race 1]|uniref:Cytochrome b5 heme-binding domain-containing protein n=1 Tax=Puccinia triticina (isolate 1-1 / race 1 (BBBD)) TaxID=630390 RepID=A0A0C4ELL1_PUCT1|nr:hypothetical protein PTTG_01645 [Puccinia triticina 1-1 BBBD Race 1]